MADVAIKTEIAFVRSYLCDDLCGLPVFSSNCSSCQCRRQWSQTTYFLIGCTKWQERGRKLAQTQFQQWPSFNTCSVNRQSKRLAVKVWWRCCSCLPASKPAAQEVMRFLFSSSGRFPIQGGRFKKSMSARNSHDIAISLFIYHIFTALATVNVVYYVQCGSGGCNTGNGIMGWVGCTGYCSPFGPLFHFLCDIHHSHTVHNRYMVLRGLEKFETFYTSLNQFVLVEELTLLICHT